MALKFNCNNCNEEIITNYAKVGDAIICKKCRQGMNVPENAITIKEKSDKEILIQKRHNTIRVLVRFGNFIGWFLIITIVFIPVGLLLLFMGHMVLANLETEHNTRETATLLRELIEKKNT